MLRSSRGVVFSKRAVLWTAVETKDTRRDQRLGRGGRELRSVRGGRRAVHPCEAGRDRADALQADREADVGDRVVCRAQQRCRALEPPGEKVRVRRLAERAAKLAAEVCA